MGLFSVDRPAQLVLEHSFRKSDATSFLAWRRVEGGGGPCRRPRLTRDLTRHRHVGACGLSAAGLDRPRLPWTVHAEIWTARSLLLRPCIELRTLRRLL